MQERLESERRRKEEEIASLGKASSSTSNTSLLDAVLLEKEELLETKRRLVEMVSVSEVKQRESACPSTADASVTAADDRLVVLDFVERSEKFERLKLFEFEKKFDRLKTGFADVRDQKDSDMSVEVERLRMALDQAKQDRNRVHADVDKFRTTIEGIGTELDALRVSNQRLSQENERMAAIIDRYNAVLESSAAQDFMNEHSSNSQLSDKQSTAFENLNRDLREEITMLQERNRLLSEESRLLSEVNAHMKKQEETDSKRTQLLEKKFREFDYE
ncbi:unnamed protein product [Cylicocyclus nassatus]|uniref:Uncharacterized protein n=1 Tax=Cylicocyclus nassatus TaxID=53992 RepID=A0AA36GV40_CYLNA|nr:unnamed protein product [Cylicocyclus nassatus]